MNSYNYTSMSNMLFLDIEAVREYETFENFTKEKNLDNWKKVAAKHYADVLKTDVIQTDSEIYLGKAGLYPEYAKVVCVALGMVTVDLSSSVEEPISSKLFDVTSHDELSILLKIANQLEKAMKANPQTILCGHNILEYDIPFLSKRMIKYGIQVPELLRNAIYGKPWEIKVTDTMRDWRMNTSKYMSMDTICEFLGIPSSKHGEVNGSNLGDYYWNSKSQWNLENERNDKFLNEIAKYCKLDVKNVISICEKLAKV